MTEVIMEAIIAELYEQSRSDAADAPTVWDRDNPDFVTIDGTVNVRRLAVAILARR